MDSLRTVVIQIASDLFVTNGVHDYAEDMVDNGHTVYLYNFEYCSPKVFGVTRWSMPFHGILIVCFHIAPLFGQTSTKRSMNLTILASFLFCLLIRVLKCEHQ